MNISTATINRANALDGPESLAFKRYMALPKKLAMAMKLSHYLSGNADTDFVDSVNCLFSGMSDSEFKIWLLANCVSVAKI